MTEIFEALAVIGDAVTEEDRVVHLLASLPDSYDMLVTALEAQSENVPRWELVTERLLHEELKLKEKGLSRTDSDGRRALLTTQKKPKKQFTCHYCKKPGHFKRDCTKFLATQQGSCKKEQKEAAKVSVQRAISGSDDEALVATRALTTCSKESWIVDSGATSHMCNNENLFVEMRQLNIRQEVVLGDGHSLEATAEGTVKLETLLPNGNTQKCTLKNVLLVPKLSYSLLSVSKMVEAGKTTKFDKSGCEILNEEKKVIAFATRAGNLYHLEYCRKHEKVNTAETEKEQLWHRRYGHIGEQTLKKLATGKLVKQFNYDVSKSTSFCESCIGGKQHRTPFDSSKRQTSELLELVHSDVCGKVSEKSIGEAQYFLTFPDDKSRYSWVYILKSKDEVFGKFLEWKALVENSTKKRVRTLRTDNGGEYTSTQFKNYLKGQGIRHELTIPKTPEQNGVAERLNRTLVEMARSMLLDAKLPKRFWAEAISTAVYLKNRSTTKSLSMTPYEAWHGSQPKANHLRVFGCDAYSHIPKDERGKFDSKTRKCIMLGYGDVTKGYRLFDVDKQKVIHSRDVHFNESVKNSGQDMSDVNDVHKYQLVVDFSDVEADDGPGNIDAENDLPNPEIPRQRPVRERRPPNYYGREESHLTETPTTLKHALSSPDQAKWKVAMETEMRSLRENEVWELVKLPPGRKTVGSKWVYKQKTGPDGSVERFKARLVAQGYTQQYGTDYDETFCPVVRQESLRVLLALSVQHGLKLHQVDVTTAFLNGALEEEVFMRQPEGFEIKGKKHLVCKLKKSIYGLKQSPRCWNVALDTHLKEMGFTQSNNDPCIYHKNTGGDMLLMGVYVDDIILAGKKESDLEQVKTALGKKFDIKDLGQLSYFLGVKVKQQRNGAIWIGQPTYTKNILSEFGMQDCKPVSTPVSVEAKLTKATDDENCIDQKKYQSAIGSLMYLSVSTRPDISYAVSSLARFSSKPTQRHWVALKRLLRYLKGTTKHGILYKREGPSACIGFSDADWAGDTNDRKSTSGYMFMINGGAISWKSQKQRCVALSTAEAEYVAMASAAQESVWLRQLIAELTNASKPSTLIYEDNQSAIAMTKNPQFHGRAKHIDIKHHFIREQVAQGVITLEYCPTTEMTADILTKGLSRETFCKLRVKAGVMEE